MRTPQQRARPRRSSPREHGDVVQRPDGRAAPGAVRGGPHDAHPARDAVDDDVEEAPPEGAPDEREDAQRARGPGRARGASCEKRASVAARGVERIAARAIARDASVDPRLSAARPRCSSASTSTTPSRARFAARSKRSRRAASSRTRPTRSTASGAISRTRTPSSASTPSREWSGRTRSRSSAPISPTSRATRSSRTRCTGCSGAFCRGRTPSSSGATREVPKLVQMKRKNVGIRVPACEATRALARELGRPDHLVDRGAPRARSPSSTPTRSTRRSRGSRWSSTEARVASSRPPSST